MSNYSPVEVNYSIKVCVFQVANDSIYILAPSLLLNYSSSYKTKDEL